MSVALGEENVVVEDFLEHYGVKGMRWGKRNVRSDEAERKARFSPKAKKIALGTAAVAGAALVAVLAAKSGGVKVSSLGGLTDRNSPLYQATVAGKKAANYTMSSAGKTKMADIPNATKALAANPRIRAIAAGAATQAVTKATTTRPTTSMNAAANKKLLDDVRKSWDDPNTVWEF